MFNLLTVGFEFNDEFYYSLIRVKPKATYTDYEITVMNGKLEKLLYGNHVLKQINNSLEVEILETNEQGMLKFAIAEALGKFLKLPLERKTRNDIPKYGMEISAAAGY